MRQWPQILFVVDCVVMFANVCLLSSLQRVIKPSPFLKVVDIGVTVFVLGFGGFFSVWGWTP